MPHECSSGSCAIMHRQSLFTVSIMLLLYPLTIPLPPPLASPPFTEGIRQAPCSGWLKNRNMLAILFIICHHKNYRKMKCSPSGKQAAQITHFPLLKISNLHFLIIFIDYLFKGSKSPPIHWKRLFYFL